MLATDDEERRVPMERGGRHTPQREGSRALSLTTSLPSSGLPEDHSCMQADWKEQLFSLPSAFFCLRIGALGPRCRGALALRCPPA